MPQFLNEGNPGWGNALSSIGSSLANWGMNQMQIKQEREQKAQDLAREEELWKQHTDTALRLGAPQERIQQVRDAQTGKAMEIRQRLKLGSAVQGTASEWEDVGAPTEAPPPPKKFAAGFGFYDDTGKSYPDKAVQDAELQQKRAGASNTSITLPGQKQTSAFQTKIGELDANRIQKMRDDAAAAGEVLQHLDVIKQITQAQATGKPEQALAIAGQFFGSKAGASLQAMNKTIGPLILASAQKLKPLSNSDIGFVSDMMPSFGSDPRANATAIDMLEKAANLQIKNADAAEAWASENESLRGWKPMYQAERTDINETGLGNKPEQSGGAPSVGTVKRGYRFKGGDPSNPESWEKV